MVSRLMATLIDGKAVSAEVRAQLALDVAEFKAQTGHTPGLVTILVGEAPASEVYVRKRHAPSRGPAMASSQEPMPATATQAEVEEMVERFNADDRVDGILVQ